MELNWFVLFCFQLIEFDLFDWLDSFDLIQMWINIWLIWLIHLLDCFNWFGWLIYLISFLIDLVDLIWSTCGLKIYIKYLYMYCWMVKSNHGMLLWRTCRKKGMKFIWVFAIADSSFTIDRYWKKNDRLILSLIATCLRLI